MPAISKKQRVDNLNIIDKRLEVVSGVDDLMILYGSYKKKIIDELKIENGYTDTKIKQDLGTKILDKK